ncbi:MAG: hypothetical protein KJ698_02325, partial [Actinobacteria bacterium]|nr:hypothetical protein [Actinomycetota bacterium]
ALAAAGCADDGAGTTVTEATTTSVTTTTVVDAAPALLIDSDATLADDPHAARQRPVELDLRVLLDDNGRARRIEEITLNLFPDVTYTGVITEVNEEGNGYSWLGYLKGIEVSSLTMVYTGSAFAANFGSPEGVYEVSSAGEGLYKVVLIDQGTYPGEG